MVELELNKRTDHDLLVIVTTEIQHLRREFDKVSNGVGFNRCVERLGRIQQLEECTEELGKTQKLYDKAKDKFGNWIKYTVAGSIVTVVIVEVISHWIGR